jgi:hypothetical protein
MPIVKIDVDDETYRKLADDAVAERRPIVWQAEVALRRALGLPFPYKPVPGPGPLSAPAGESPDARS